MPPASRDRASFERELLALLPAAYSLAFLLLRVRADAEDAVQDASVRAFRAYGQLEGEVKPWLLAIVRNVCYRRLQARRRATNVISLDEALGAPGGGNVDALRARDRSPEEAVVLDAERSMLAQALQRLAPVFREVVVLREIEELSYREIADVIGAPIGTVMSRLSRGRRDLREAMTRLMEEADRHEL